MNDWFWNVIIQLDEAASNVELSTEVFERGAFCQPYDLTCMQNTYILQSGLQECTDIARFNQSNQYDEA